MAEGDTTPEQRGEEDDPLWQYVDEVMSEGSMKVLNLPSKTNGFSILSILNENDTSLTDLLKDEEEEQRGNLDSEERPTEEAVAVVSSTAQRKRRHRAVEEGVTAPKRRKGQDDNSSPDIKKRRRTRPLVLSVTGRQLTRCLESFRPEMVLIIENGRVPPSVDRRAADIRSYFGHQRQLDIYNFVVGQFPNVVRDKGMDFIIDTMMPMVMLMVYKAIMGHPPPLTDDHQ